MIGDSIPFLIVPLGITWWVEHVGLKSPSSVHVQKAIREAVLKTKIKKRASAHTFRHSFASHLLQANYDIRTIQELMGHSDIKTTMIYTHTIKSQTLKEAKSPLDF